MFEANKEYWTRDGRRARVYATDGVGNWPIHGAILYATKGWQVQTWRASGSSAFMDATNPADLMPPRPPVVVSDAVLKAWRNGYWGHDRPNVHSDNAVRTGIAAAIEAWRDEQADP
jgi:hypothetical protein